jgi:hypothetical protein
MSERLRPAHARPPSIASRVVAVAGAVGLVGLLLLLAYRVGGGDHGPPRAAPSTSVSPGAGRGSSPASGPSWSADSRGPAGQAASAGFPGSGAGLGASASARPGESGSGPAAAPTQTPTVSGRSPSSGAPTPSGAPHTGGGSGPGVRNPVLLGTGIVLLLAAGVLVLVRIRPADTGI